MSKYQASKDRYKEITSGIYAIINKLDGKMYIGSAIILQKRKSEHFLALRKNKHANRYLQFAYNKHGLENFEFKILEVLKNEKLLILQEQYWMDLYNSFAPNGYNLKLFAISNLGMKHSAETRKKISEVQIGRKASEETKAKMSATRKGRKQSPEWIAKRNKTRNETLKLNKILACVILIDGVKFEE